VKTETRQEKAMGDTARVTINMETIRAELIRQAREDYDEETLKGLEKLPATSRQKHKRYHTPYVTKDIVAKARPGSWCTCAYNIALRAMPGVFAAITMRRVVHTLEKDEHGNWAIYDFATPPLAAERILEFDKLKGMPEHMISIKPLPRSWHREVSAKTKAKSAKNKNRKVIKRAQKPRDLQRTVALRDFMNGAAV
jgi:hypothetical protein